MQTRVEMRHHIAVLVAKNVDYGHINSGANAGDKLCLRAEEGARKRAANQLEKVLGYLDELYSRVQDAEDAEQELFDAKSCSWWSGW